MSNPESYCVCGEPETVKDPQNLAQMLELMAHNLKTASKDVDWVLTATTGYYEPMQRTCFMLVAVGVPRV